MKYTYIDRYVLPGCCKHCLSQCPQDPSDPSGMGWCHNCKKYAYPVFDKDEIRKLKLNLILDK